MSQLPLTPKSLPNPGKPPTPSKTVERWDSFLGAIASGTPLADAMLKTYISRADIETMTRLPGGLELARWTEARHAGRKSAWSILDFEEIFARIAEGSTVVEALTAVRGTKDAVGFYHIINSDPELNAMFRKAKEACSINMVEDILPLADDKTGDVIDTPKGPIPNNAAVQRSKLQVDTRLRIVGSYHSRLFGEKKDQVNVQVNINHAERLEEARNRATLRDKKITPKQMRDAIDATFSEKPPAPAAEAWEDEKPTDAIWREES